MNTQNLPVHRPPFEGVSKAARRKRALNEKAACQKAIDAVFNNAATPSPKIQLSKNTVSFPTIKPRQPFPPIIRQTVWYAFMGNRMHGMCFCCNTTPISLSFFQVGHIEARSHGGPDHISNLRPICGSCNTEMGSTNMIEYMDSYGLWVRPDFYNERYPKLMVTPSVKIEDQGLYNLPDLEQLDSCEPEWDE